MPNEELIEYLKKRQANGEKLFSGHPEMRSRPKRLWSGVKNTDWSSML